MPVSIACECQSHTLVLSQSVAPSLPCLGLRECAFSGPSQSNDPSTWPCLPGEVAAKSWGSGFEELEAWKMSPFLPPGRSRGVSLHLPTWCVWHTYYCVTCIHCISKVCIYTVYLMCICVVCVMWVMCRVYVSVWGGVCVCAMCMFVCCVRYMCLLCVFEWVGWSVWHA